MLEKKKPHYELGRIKELVASPATRRITRTAFDGAAALGWSDPEIVDCVQGLKMSDFYKSMTTHADSRVWQDVYRPKFLGEDLYVKVQISTDEKTVVISFKLGTEGP